MSYLSLITTAVKSGDKSTRDMTAAAAALNKAFISVDAMGEADISAVKAAIINGFSKDQQSLIMADKATVKDWSAEKKAERKNAQTKVTVYFGRLIRAAWPKSKEEKGDSESSADKAKAEDKAEASRLDTWAKTLSALIDQANKADLQFDKVAFVKALSVARSFVAIVK